MSVHFQDGGGDYWFDAEAAEAAVRFFPENLFLTTGEWAGRPFDLAKFQAETIIRPMFGWKRADGTRRFRRVIVWIPRKNGKTELAAGIAVALLVGDEEPGAQVFSIATDKNQASICFDKAVQMLGYSAPLQPHLHAFKNAMYCPAINGSFRPLSGIPKGKHGLNMSGLVGDELHEWADDRLYQFVHQSSASRRQPLEFLISTAGEMKGFGYEVWKECQGIIDGSIVDLETLVIVFAADPDQDKADPDYWKRESTWAAANPNYPMSPKKEYLEAECRKAQRLPRLENDFKRYHLNLWVEQATRWLPMDLWKDCGAPPAQRPELRARHEAILNGTWQPPTNGPAIIVERRNDRWKAFRERFKGRRAYAGGDLSSTKDLSCVSWVFPPEGDEEVTTVIPRFYVPRQTLKDRVKSDKVPYDLWEREGALQTTPGNAIDYDWIKADILKDAAHFDLRTISFDRFLSLQIAIQLNEEGLDAQQMGQGFVSMSAPSKELETLILDLKLDHGGHPVLTWCARNAAIDTDPAGNIKPSKKGSTERIDGVVATVNALWAMSQAPVEYDLTEALKNPVIR
jgi:phage terminase large subunit-like protein